jgi:hypothetical protein
MGGGTLALCGREGHEQACGAEECGVMCALASCYRLGRDRGSPNHGSTLLSKRVMAEIR